MLYDNFTKRRGSVHTPSKLSRKDKLAGPRFFASLPHSGMLIWVRDAINQGYSWNPPNGELGMCRLNGVGGGGGGGYNASATAGDAPGFYCGCCGSWAVSTISWDAGVSSPYVVGPCENMGNLANAGYGGYINSGCEPLPAVLPRTDAHARFREQPVHIVPAIGESAGFGFEATGFLPVVEDPIVGNLVSTGVWGPSGLDYHYGLSANADSLVLPEQSTPQASSPTAMSVHADHTFNRVSDVPNQHSGKQRFACPVAGCVITLSRQADVPRHIGTAHGNKERYCCDFPGCKKSFSRQAKVTAHEREHYI